MLYLPLKTVQYILTRFEQKFNGYSLSNYSINEFEKVVVIEDSLVIYMGIIESEMPVCLNAEELYKERINNLYLGIPKVGEKYYELFIEELTYNTLEWKYIHTKFLRELEKIIQIDHLGLDIHYSKFRGYRSLYWCPELPTLVEKIEVQLPQLKLRDRYELWEGILYYFIILEAKDVSGNVEYGVAYTNQKPTNYVINKCRIWIQEGFNQGDIRMIGQKFINSLKSWKGVKRQERLEKYLTYFYIEKYIREKEDAWKYADLLLHYAYEDTFKNVERSTYLKPSNKWKTEELVFNTVKKLFPNHKVIYQYRPYFLKSKKGGQLSYDIFISGLNIAIEYQGKQHFEPVDFFGGVAAYRRNVERDKEKGELSSLNGIRLVYINYWEVVTPQLIRKKIEDVISIP